MKTFTGGYDSALLQGSDVDPRWNDGPFALVKSTMKAKGAGKRYEEIGKWVLSKVGYKVEGRLSKEVDPHAKSTDYDMILNSKKTEFKGSAVTKGSDNKFSFLQIRPAQVYDQVLLMTMHFNGDLRFYLVPKKDMQKYIANCLLDKEDRNPDMPKLAVQHGGKKRKGDIGPRTTFSYNGSMKAFDKHFIFVYHYTNETSRRTK